MNLKKTAFLALILAALSSYIYWVEIAGDKEKQRTEALLPELKKESIQKISLKNDKGEFALINNDVKSSPQKITEKKDGLSSDALGATWGIEGVKGSTLDSGALGTLLNALLETKLASQIPESEVEKDLSIYGLASPALSLTVAYDGGATVLSLGKKNEFVSKQYASVKGRPEIFLIAQTLGMSGDKSKNDFRDKTPFRFTDFDLASITFKSETGTYTFLQGEDGKWKLGEPLKYSGSSSAIMDLLRQIRALQVSDWIDPSETGEVDREPYGLTKPYFSIACSYKGDKKPPVEFTFGKPKDGSDSSVMYGSMSGVPSLFKLQADLVQKLNRPINDLREKEFTRFSISEVSKVTFEGSKVQKLEIAKDGEEWKVNGKAGDAPFVTTLLTSLSSLSAVGFPAASRDFGFASPILKVTIEKLKVGETTPDSITLLVGSEVTPEDRGIVDGKAVSGYYGTTGNQDEPFVLSKESVEKISPREETLIKVPSPSPSPDSNGK